MDSSFEDKKKVDLLSIYIVVWCKYISFSDGSRSHQVRTCKHCWVATQSNTSLTRGSQVHRAKNYQETLHEVWDGSNNMTPSFSACHTLCHPAVKLYQEIIILIIIIMQKTQSGAVSEMPCLWAGTGTYPTPNVIVWFTRNSCSLSNLTRNYSNKEMSIRLIPEKEVSDYTVKEGRGEVDKGYEENRFGIFCSEKIFLASVNICLGLKAPKWESIR